MDTIASTVCSSVQQRFPQGVVETIEHRGEQTLVVTPESLVSICDFLKKHEQFTYLSTVTAVDWPERVPRFDIVYQLLSIPRQSVLALKIRVGQRREKQPAAPTVSTVWPAANWYEREIYDLFGIIFTNHPDLRRILMPNDWTTHPLRKDYPLSGFDLPEPHWGGQVPYDVDPGVGNQTLRTSEGRELNESRSHLTNNQEPGMPKP